MVVRGEKLYLADHSALSRIHSHATVKKAFDRIAASGVICSNAVTVDEASYSARNPADLEQIVSLYTEAFRYLPLDPAIDPVSRALRKALWASGHGRSAQTTDVLIAATAVQVDAIVLHYDKHFELMQMAFPALRQQWVVPRGTIAD